MPHSIQKSWDGIGEPSTCDAYMVCTEASTMQFPQLAMGIALPVSMCITAFGESITSKSCQ